MREHVVFRIGVAVAILVSSFTSLPQTLYAQISGVGWIYYGGVTTNDQQSRCFYDVSGVTKLEYANLVRVWTKCLPQTEIESIDIKKDYEGRILETTARKIAAYYVPPLAAFETIDFDTAMAIVQFEVTADIAFIDPITKIITS